MDLSQLSSSKINRSEKSPRLRQWVFFVCVLLLQLGCATYQGKVNEARLLISNRQIDEALKVLEPLAQKPGDDQLVYLLDYAVALQQAGRFKDSAKVLAQAERIADIQDYTSLSKETASLILSENMVQYKGDDYEKVLINGVNAVNYLMLEDLEAALVEVRRLNNKLHLYRTDGKKNYDQNPFAFYLGAMIWEADRKWDDAYIAYKKAYELIPNYAPLHEDLVRAAIKAQRPEEVEKWQKKYPEAKPRPEWKDSSLGELVLIFQQGWGPRKYPHPNSPRVPKLYPVKSYTARAKVDIQPVKDEPKGIPSATTEMIYSVEDVAMKTLNDQYAALITKRVAGVAAKAVVADQIRQKYGALGDIAWIALNVTDQADLRQWSTLPESFQIARVYLPPGQYTIGVKGISMSGDETGENMNPRDIEIKPGRKSFLTWRSFR